MTHSHLTAEEMEFLRTGAACEAAAERDRLPPSRAEALSHVQHVRCQQDEVLAERLFGDDQLHGLRAIHEQFARQAAEALQGPLRAPVAIRVERIEQRTFSEIVFDLQNPTCLQVLTGDQPAVSPVILDMQLGALFPMMDRLLGGQEGAPIVPRALTEIERRLVGRLTGLLLTQLSNAWSRVAAMQWDVELLESNPQAVRSVAPGELCAVIVMEIAFGRARGQMRCVFPRHGLAPLLENIAAEQQWPEGEDSHVAEDARSPEDPVPLSVTLAESTLRRSDLLGLQVGDLLATESDACSPATLKIDDVNQFVARVGTHEGHKAVRIEGRRDDPE